MFHRTRALPTSCLALLTHAWESLSHPGFLRLRIERAPQVASGPEFLGLNESLVAQQASNERVRVFADRSFEGALTSPLGTLLLASVGAAMAGWSTALAWWACFSMVELLIGRAGYLYRQGPGRTVSALEQARRLVFLSFLAGLAWGSAPWVFWGDGQFEAYMLLLLILVGVAGLSLLTMSPYLGAMISFYAGLLLLPAAHALTLSHPLGWKLALAMCLLYAVLLQFGSTVGLQLTSEIEASIRSRLLAERLRLALSAAEQDWFDLDVQTGEMISSQRCAGSVTPDPPDAPCGLIAWLDRIHPDDRHAAGAAFGVNLDGSDAAEVEYRLRKADGSSAWVHSMGRVVARDADGRPQRVIGVHSDITEAKAAEETIRRLAFHDHLTGLPNRRLLADRLQHALATASRRNSNGALLLLDMDDFKALNDTHGHELGDQFLKEVANRLRRSVLDSDTVARMGGDEFVILLEHLGHGEQAALQAEQVAEKILLAVRQPYVLQPPSVAGVPQTYGYHCTASIGVATFTDNSISADELYKRADTAMYHAKAEGRNAIRFFDPQMQLRVSERAALANELREGVLAGQFELYYQPQVDAQGRIIGSEALLRWLHPTRGLVTPDRFIEVAETMGLIQPIGRWVIETASAQLVAWSARPEAAHLTVSVNVSAAQFRDGHFLDHIRRVLDDTGADPRKLKLEVTESVAMTNVDEVIEKMSWLKARGVGIALDDFGTGHSSLAYLKRLPIDELKIDRSFVRDALSDPNDAVIVQTIIALGNSMGLVVIAEGVETEAQRLFLAGHGCHNYQGYFFGRPTPIDRFDALLREPETLACA